MPESWEKIGLGAGVASEDERFPMLKEQLLLKERENCIYDYF